MPNETVLKEELAFYFVLELRFMLVALSSFRLLIRDLNKARISEEHH
jgi:hypothetical protein